MRNIFIIRVKMDSGTMAHGDSSTHDGIRGRLSRRRFVEALGASSAAAGLAGCLGDDDDETAADDDTDDDDDDDDEIEVGEVTGGVVQMDLGGTVQAGEEELQQALWDAGLDEDIEIDLINTSGVSDDVESQFREWLAAGRTEPDVLRMDNGWLRAFIVRNQIMNLEAVLDDETVDRVKEDYYEAGVVSASDENGVLYGVPFQIGFPMMFYRRDLIEDAGYDPEGENWATEGMSWAEFSEIVDDVHSQNPDIDYGLATQLDAYEGLSCCTFNEFMSSWGGAYFGGREYLFGPVNDRPITVTDEPVINAIRMVRTMIRGEEDEYALDGYEQIISDAALQWTEGTSMAEFQDGNSVALRFWPSAIPTLGPDMGDDLGAMPIPYGVPEEDSEYEGLGGLTAALGGWALTINPNTENLPEAVEVIKHMMDPDVRYTLLEIGTIPPEPALLEPDAVESVDPVFAEHADAFNVAGENAVPRPVTLAWPEQSTAIAREVNETLGGQKSPEDAMNDLEVSLQELEEISEV